MALTAPPNPNPAPGGLPQDATVPPAPRIVRRRTFLGSRRRQVGAVLVIVAAVGFLLFQGLSNATEYFKTANQAVADRASLGTRQFRIEGTVDNNVRRVGNETAFSITANHVTVPVVDTKEPPELFKPGIPVVLEGHFATTGPVFHSDLIMVKHSASYVAAHPNRVKAQTPAPAAPAAPK